MTGSPEETDNCSDGQQPEDTTGDTTGDPARGSGAFSPRPTFARLRDEQQRVAGGGRWSVDASRRQCHRCQQEIPRGTSFWTVLAEADADQAGEVVAAFFSRQDHCEGCIEGLEEDPFFARWKTSVPAPDGPPRRIVNIVSLHATFVSLMEASGYSSEDTDSAEDTRSRRDSRCRRKRTGSASPTCSHCSWCASEFCAGSATSSRCYRCRSALEPSTGWQSPPSTPPPWRRRWRNWKSSSASGPLPHWLP